MAQRSIGDVEALLGLPATTLRYWEKAVPLLSPRKDEWGRRVYSEADIRVLLRLRHLVQYRGMAVSAAGEAIMAEGAALRGTGPLEEFRARLAEIRGELIGLWFESAESGRSLEEHLR